MLLLHIHLSSLYFDPLARLRPQHSFYTYIPLIRSSQPTCCCSIPMAAIFDAAGNCSFVPDSVQTDAGVAGAGVSHLFCEREGHADNADFAFIHYYELHFFVPQRCHYPTRLAQINLGASMPQATTVLFGSANHHRHWYPVYRPGKNAIDGTVPFLHHLAPITALYGDKSRNTSCPGERFQA